MCWNVYLPSCVLNAVWYEMKRVFSFRNKIYHFSQTIIMLNALCVHILLVQCFTKLKCCVDFLSEQNEHLRMILCLCLCVPVKLNCFFVCIQTIWMGYLSGSFFFYGVIYTILTMAIAHNFFLICQFTRAHIDIHYIQHVFLNGLWLCAECVCVCVCVWSLHGNKWRLNILNM